MGRTALRLATGAPLLALAWYVAGLTPSVPLFDHWPLFDLYHAIATGQAGARDFFAPHNGIHVIVVPRLFLSALALATGWSMRAEILVSFVIVLATFFALTRIAEAGAGPRRAPVLLANGLTALLLCSPVAYWSWVWSCGFFHFLINACAVFGAWALIPTKPGREVRQVGIAAGICAIATFSRAEGLGLWFVLAPGLLHLTAAHPRRGRLLAGWVFAASLCAALVALSVFALREPATTASMARSWLDAPFPRLAMVASLVGLPFGAGLADALIEGGAISASVPVLAPVGVGVATLFGVLALGWLFGREDPKRGAALAAVSIGGLGLAFVTASGVIRYGVLDSGLLGDFWPSNYATSAALISIAVVQLLAIRAARPSARRFDGALITLLIGGVLVAGSWIAKAPAALDIRARTENSDVCWEVYTKLDDINSCFGRLFTDDRGDRVAAVGFRRIRRDLVFDPEATDRGAVEGVRVRRDGSRELTGWVRRDTGAPDPIVFLSRGEGRRLFALAIPTGRDGDRLVWRAELFVDRPGTTYRAWRYDRAAGRFERLEGRVVVDADPAPTPDAAS